MKKFIPPRKLTWVISFSTMLSTLLVLTWISCRENPMEKKAAANDQPQLTDEEMKRSVLLDTSYLLPKEMAQKTVMSVVAQFKDGKTRTLRNLDAVPSLYSFTGKTAINTDFKISKPETPSLYVANFTDEEGYVIISADMRAPEILGYSASGNIDSTVHNGLKLTLINALQHVDEKVAEAETMRYDSTFHVMVKKMEDHLAKKTGKKLPLHNGKKPKTATREMDYYGECHTYYSAYPILVQTGVESQTGPLLQTEWTQNPPFNDQYFGFLCDQRGTYRDAPTGRTRVFTNSHYLAGCVPIAEAQILAYLAANYSDPSFEGISRQGWRNLTAKSPVDYTAGDVAHVSALVKHVYDSYGWWLIATCGATGGGGLNADLFKISPRGLRLWNSNASWKDYNEGDIKNSILQSSPVLIGGCTKLNCLDINISWNWIGLKIYWKMVCVGGGDCHLWVLDGWRDIQTITTYQCYWSYSDACAMSDRSSTYTSTQITRSLIHNNWGWGANSNTGDAAWFAPGVFGGEGSNFNRAKYIVPFLR